MILKNKFRRQPASNLSVRRSRADPWPCRQLLPSVYLRRRLTRQHYMRSRSTSTPVSRLIASHCGAPISRSHNAVSRQPLEVVSRLSGSEENRRLHTVKTGSNICQVASRPVSRPQCESALRGIRLTSGPNSPLSRNVLSLNR